MKFSLAVYAAPFSSQASDSAYRFALALLGQGHTLYRVFFYSDGVHTGSNLAAPPQDEPNLPKHWQELAKDHQLDVVVCIAAALRRGILNNTEAKRYERSGANLNLDFHLSGLGQLLDAAVSSDRLVTFGH